MAKREIIIELRLQDQDAINRLGKLEVETKLYQKELRALNAEIVKNGQATAAQINRVGELNAIIRRNQGEIRELKNDVSGLTDAGLRFRDKMAQAFGQTLTPLFDKLSGSLDKTQQEMAQALRTFGAESVEFRKAAESVERLEKGMNELRDAQKAASAAIVQFGENSKEFKEANDRLKGLEETARNLALEVAEQVEPKFVALSRQIREARREAQEAAENFGFMSDEFRKAAERADDLEDQMKAVNATVQSIDTEGKIETFGRALQGVTGAFSLAQGAAALFGSESKAVEEALLKVQAAIAIQQGVSGLIEGAKAAKALALSLGLVGPAAESGTVATRILGLTMNALPLLAVLSGLTAIATAVALYNSNTEEAVRSTDALNTNIDKLNARNEKFIDTLAQEALANLELAKLREGRTEDSIADIEERTRIEQQAIQRRLAIVRNGISEEEAAYAKAVADQKKAREDDNSENFKTALENQKAAWSRLDAYYAQVEELEDSARLVAKQGQINAAKFRLDLQKQTNDKALTEEQRHLLEMKALADKARQEATPERITPIDQTGAGQQAAENTLTPAAERIPESRTQEQINQYYSDLFDLYAAEKEAFVELQDAKIASIGQFASALGQLAQDGSAAAKVFFAIEKAAAIGSIIAQANQAIVAAQAAAASIPPLIPPGIPNPAFAAAQGIAAAQIAKIKTQAGVGIGTIVAQAIGGFHDGGYTSQKASNHEPVGVVHANEWVAPAWMVKSPAFAPILGQLEDFRKMRGLTSMTDGFFLGGRTTRGTALVNSRRAPDVPGAVITSADLARAIRGINMQPVVRVTDIIDTMGSVVRVNQASAL